jgi:hypothetical protein
MIIFLRGYVNALGYNQRAFSKPIPANLPE